MLHLIKKRGLDGQVSVDSAGTASFHTGHQADSRSVEAARKRGVELPSRARQFTEDDFERFDYVLACDTNNLRDLRALATEEQRAKIHLLLDFDRALPAGRSVPDPYFGGPQGFETVLDLCESVCSQLLDHLIEKYGLSPHSP